MESRNEFLRAEKAFYEAILEAIPRIKEVVRAYNGKVINKRLSEAIYESVKRDYYDPISVWVEYPYVAFRTHIDKEGCHDELRTHIYFGRNVSGEKERVDYGRVLVMLNEQTDKIKQKIERLDESKIDVIREEFSSILDALSAFQKKYDSRMIEIAGCDCRVQPNYMSDYDLIWKAGIM